MPQAVAATFAFLASGTALATIANIGISIGVNFALAKINQPKGPKPRDLQTQIRSGAAERMAHFGRVRVSGSLMFSDYHYFPDDITVFGITIPRGTNRAYVLLAISTGEVSGVDQWFLDGKKVSVNAQGWVQTSPWRNRVRLRLRTGGGAEINGGDWADLRAAFPERWTADHRLRGVATILGEFNSVDAEDVADVYPGGRPPEISAVIRGMPCIEPATGNYSFTTNPVRHLLHFLSTAGVGKIPLAEFDLSIWDQARVDCIDNLPTLTGPTRPRYDGGGSFSLNEAAKDVARRILDSVAGDIYITPEGLIGIRVGKYRAPAFTIDDSKIVSMDFGLGRKEMNRVTTLVPEYVEPELFYTETTADPWENARAIARFGEPKPRELSVLWCQHHGQARAVAKIEAARQNPLLTASVKLRFWGLLLMGEERVMMNRPERFINNVPMRIRTMTIDLEGSDGIVSAELESEEVASFAWQGFEEGQRPRTPDRSVNGRPVIDAPLITDITINRNGGVLFLSGTVPDEPGRSFGVQYRKSTGGPWVRAAFNQDNGYWRTPDLEDGQNYDIRARRFRSGLSAFTWERGNDDQTSFSNWTTITNIAVIRDNNAPGNPQIVSVEVVGSQLQFSFRPDLGANYNNTQLWRGTGTFADATSIRTYYDQSSVVSGTVTVTSGSQNYWLRSGNGSGVNSAPVFLGNY